MSYVNVVSNATFGLVANGTTIASTTVIGPQSLYNQVSTATSVAYGIRLPQLPILDKEYEIKNDGVNYIAVFPFNATSTINSLAGGAAFLLGSGASIKFIANTTTSVPLQTPTDTVTWQTFSPSGADLVVNLTSAQILTAQNFAIDASYGKKVIFTVPVITAAATITLPAVAACAGCTYIFKAVGTLGFACVITGATAKITGSAFNTTGSANNGATLTKLNAGAANASVTMSATAVIGDEVIVRSDGVNYHVTGASQAASGITIP